MAEKTLGSHPVTAEVLEYYADLRARTNRRSHAPMQAEGSDQGFVKRPDLALFVLRIPENQDRADDLSLAHLLTFGELCGLSRANPAGLVRPPLFFSTAYIRTFR